MKTTTTGNWSFEIKQIFCRKTKGHGQEFEASAVITITDGEPHIELLINKHDDAFSKADHEDFRAFLASSGFTNVKFSRYKNGFKKEVERY